LQELGANNFKFSQKILNACALRMLKAVKRAALAEVWRRSLQGFNLLRIGGCYEFKN